MLGLSLHDNGLKVRLLRLTLQVQLPQNLPAYDDHGMVLVLVYHGGVLA